MTASGFRRIALGMKDASEGAHMGHPDFRVGGRIFATLGYPDAKWGMVALTPEQQEEARRAATVRVVRNRDREDRAAGSVDDRGVLAEDAEHREHDQDRDQHHRAKYEPLAGREFLHLRRILSRVVGVSAQTRWLMLPIGSSMRRLASWPAVSRQL